MQKKKEGLLSKSISLYGLNTSLDEVRDEIKETISALWKRKNAHLLDENGKLR